MIQGGVWMRSILVDSADPDNGRNDQVVWICNHCRAVVRNKMYQCPQCKQQMVAEMNPDGMIIQFECAVLQLGAEDTKIE